MIDDLSRSKLGIGRIRVAVVLRPMLCCDLGLPGASALAADAALHDVSLLKPGDII
jgi:hypothetical protein